MTDETDDMFADKLIAEQKRLDAMDRKSGEEIVAAQKLTTLDEAKRFAANWIATAAQESRNTEYMTGERDRMRRELTSVIADLDDAMQDVDPSASWGFIRKKMLKLMETT